MYFADLKVIRSTAPIGARTVKVYRPVRPIHKLFVSARANGEWTICHDIAAAQEMLVWASLAAESTDSIVWIPKSGDAPTWTRSMFEPCDLILCHHSLQLKASEWKAARAYAKKGGDRQTLSVAVPEMDDERSKQRHEEYRDSWRRRHPTPGADLADFALHSNTVFIIGSQVIFEALSEIFFFATTSTVTGDHDHFFRLARECFYENYSDITVMYHEPKDWLIPSDEAQPASP